jgi:hypothetical protein
MNPAIIKLREYLAELESRDAFPSIEEKAIHYGLIIQIKESIGQLELCEKHELTSGSLVSVLPESSSVHHQYIAAHQNESTAPENWEEVLFDGKQIWFSGGHILIRK